MADETRITIIGNLPADPELRFTPNGVALVKFGVISTPRVQDRETREWKDGEPLVLYCTAWRDLAEHIAESLVKGTRVVVTGRLSLSRWETPEGDKRSAYGLDVDDIGPSLKFAEAKVKKMSRAKANGAGDGFTPGSVPDDPWNAATPAGQAA